MGAEAPTNHGSATHTRRRFVGGAVAAAASFAFGSLFSHEAAAAGAGSAGTADFSAAFGQVIGFTPERVRLPVGEIVTTPRTTVILDEIARDSADGSPPTRADGVRYGDLVYATGKKADDGSLVAETLWSGVIAFPAVLLSRDGSDVVLSPTPGASLSAKLGPDTSFRTAWGAPSKGAPSFSEGQELVAIGIFLPGYEEMTLAALVTPA